MMSHSRPEAQAPIEVQSHGLRALQFFFTSFNTSVQKQSFSVFQEEEHYELFQQDFDNTAHPYGTSRKH